MNLKDTRVARFDQGRNVYFLFPAELLTKNVLASDDVVAGSRYLPACLLPG